LGTEHARPDFVRKITGQNVREEQPLSQGKLFQAESDLYGLGIFDWASVAAIDFQPDARTTTSIAGACMNLKEIRWMWEADLK